jgi:tRNA nucleotidyltransferase (CCA-adding enzyme)
MAGSRLGEKRAGAPQGAGARVLEALTVLPGGPELLALAGERGDAALVGGATRDLLLGSSPRELDVVVAGDAAGFARDLAARLDSPRVSAHGEFGTAGVSWHGGAVDVAERRAESYPQPGALPDVRAGSVEQDLLRRDFTVNAIAVPLAGPRRGELQSAAHALEDLSEGVLRVMHERSFTDDPTRILRLARYCARLRFAPERSTALLAAQALERGALATVSEARIGAELRLALAEPDALAALRALEQLGVLVRIDPALRLDAALARRALDLLPDDARPDLLLLALLILPLASGGHADPQATFELLDAMEFPAADRERASRAARLAPDLLARLPEEGRPSHAGVVLAGTPPEAVALALALAQDESGARARLARDWLERARHVRLEITGDDLLAAGIPAGPALGRRLERALALRIDGELEDGRDAELRAALEAEA